MKTVILPGFSLRNKDWAEEAKKNLNLDQEILIHEWKHWKSSNEKDFSVEKESEKILKEIGKEKVNILAKSVGTAVTAALIKQIAPQINKIILCGIPSTHESRYKNFGSFDGEKIICFQNKLDPWASFGEIKKLLGSINPQIKVIEKDRSDHDYPYFEDFQKFLSA